MPNDQFHRRNIAIASAIVLFTLSVLLMQEIKSTDTSTIEGQAVEVVAIAAVIISLGYIVVEWMKRKD